jgi:catechol 2,3-dioxygenase-like lactoylglutathione lyase family enzyme
MSEGTAAPPFTVEGLDHVAIAVRDVRASAAWYQEVLGLRRMHEDAWGDYPAFVGMGATGIALFPVKGPPQPPPGRDVLAMRHLAFRVDRRNFDAARRALGGRGIAFTAQHHGISESIYFVDPDGHELELTTYEL